MRNNHKAKKLATRVTAMGLTLVMGVSLIGTLSIDASAVASLKGIEEIKNNGTLSILEIVPEANSGSIGYYVGGQEPTSNWYAQIANISGEKNRSNHAKALFDSLTSSGLMSTDGTTPLTYADEYKEYKPWGIPKNVDVNTLIPLKLLQSEEQAVKGEIEECKNGETGNYAKDTKYEFAPGGADGYIENAHYYEYKQRLDAAKAYYYHVDFESIRFTEFKEGDERYVEGDVPYEEYLKAHKEVPIYTKKVSSGLPSYVYEGTLKAGEDDDGNFTLLGGFRLDLSTNENYGYYIAKPDYTTISTTRELVVKTWIPTVVDPAFVGQIVYVADDSVVADYRAVEVTANFNPYPNSDPTKNPQYYTQDATGMIPITVPTVVAPEVVGKTVYVVDPAVEDGYKAIELAVGFKPYEDPTLQYYTQDQAHSYMANTASGDSFRKADTAAGEVPFFQEKIGYRYVGDGNGDFIFSYQPEGSVEKIITYDSIYVSGGYSNNEWFKRYVLDYDLDANAEALSARPVAIKVKSVTPDSLSLVNISDYNLVVVSAGFDLTKNGSTVLYESDLTAEQVAEIKQIPRVIDTAIKENTGRTNLLSLMDGKTTPFVTGENNNVYYFAETTVDVDKLAGKKENVNSLATKWFHTPIDGANNQNSPYMAVEDEIRYENMIRGEDEVLPTDISMATCFRYVLNTRRIINNKTSLNVLDIRPAPIYDDIYDDRTGTGNNGPLTVETVVSWLPVSMQEQLAAKNADGTIKKDGDNVIYNITINHMSTAALVGKIEDITEQYDLIYIGTTTKDDWDKMKPSGVTSSNWTTEWTDWQKQLNDDGHDGKYDHNYQYVNIGATTKIQNYIKGLLNYNDTETRYSGNDLTPTKRDELVQFAEARLPIVVSSDLVTGDGSVETTKYDVSVTLELANGKIKPVLKFAPDLSPNDYEIVSYNWDCKDQSNLGTAETAPEFTPKNNYRYRCTVTVRPKNTSAGTSVAARSLYYKYTAQNNSSGMFGEPEESWTEVQRVGRTSKYSGTQTQEKYNGTLTGALTVVPTYEGEYDSNRIDNDTYQWYRGERPSEGGGNGNEVPEIDGGKQAKFNFARYPREKFYCVISFSYKGYSYQVTSPEYTWIPPGVSSASLTPIESNSSSDKATNGTMSIDRFIAGDGQIDLNESLIDPNSKMYEALDEVLTANQNHVNVFVESALDKNSRTEDDEQKLVNALNLSRPAINFPKDSDGNIVPGSVPKSYDSTNPAASSCGGNLEFKFQISNATDPDPANTRYRCELYVDQNGDGRHDPKTELISGITIQGEKNGTTKRVTQGTLQADNGITYIVSRSMNSGTGNANEYSGIVAWKLQIVKEGEGNENVHASQKGYAYIKPTEREELNILQILNSNPYFVHGGVVDLSTPVEKVDQQTQQPIDWQTQVKKSGDVLWFDDDGDSVLDKGEDLDEDGHLDINEDKNGNNKLDNDWFNNEDVDGDGRLDKVAEDVNGNGRLDVEKLSEFEKLYYDLYQAGMYDIKVETIQVNELNAMQGNPNKDTTAREEIAGYLQENYDMLIIGFHDVYGDLNTDCANAITDYIGTGKSLLFTHDTTSYWNDLSYPNQSADTRPGWGYWFNQVIRDAVGLDRYGITSSDSDIASAVANGNDGYITETPGLVEKLTGEEEDREGKIYTVAYKPGPVVTSARQTQGYTNSIIERNKSTGAKSGNKTTTYVSQVNRGQITEYPFDLPETLEIEDTHSQYYQLNMNDDDVVVWYCLGGSTFADEKNDATNAYYIYNKGNITYSGAGHTEGLSDGERMLFVNTMIAAYRAGNSPASVSFRTASDDPASALLFPVQYSDKDTAVSLGGEQTTYFKIQDRNLTSGNTLSVKVYYEVYVNSEEEAEEIGAEPATDVGIKTGDEITSAGRYVKEVTAKTAGEYPVKIYRNGNLVDPDDLNSDVLYKMEVPPEALSYVAGSNGNGALYLVATTVIHSDAGDVTYKSFDDLMLQKLGLLRLE